MSPSRLLPQAPHVVVSPAAPSRTEKQRRTSPSRSSSQLEKGRRGWPTRRPGHPTRYGDAPRAVPIADGRRPAEDPSLDREVERSDLQDVPPNISWMGLEVIGDSFDSCFPSRTARWTDGYTVATLDPIRLRRCSPPTGRSADEGEPPL